MLLVFRTENLVLDMLRFPSEESFGNHGLIKYGKDILFIPCQ